MPKKTTQTVLKTWRTIPQRHGWSARTPKPKKVKPPRRKRVLQSALVLLALGSEPLPVEQVIKATGLPAFRVSALLRELVAEGRVIVTREGFRRVT
jgi:predicted Rossmann fold nucleotide-binding protein DprA/Smf involved in DNA uptake